MSLLPGAPLCSQNSTNVGHLPPTQGTQSCLLSSNYPRVLGPSCQWGPQIFPNPGACASVSQPKGLGPRPALVLTIASGCMWECLCDHQGRACDRQLTTGASPSPLGHLWRSAAPIDHRSSCLSHSPKTGVQVWSGRRVSTTVSRCISKCILLCLVSSGSSSILGVQSHPRGHNILSPYLLRSHGIWLKTSSSVFLRYLA